jgi:hypothetical protein
MTAGLIDHSLNAGVLIGTSALFGAGLMSPEGTAAVQRLGVEVDGTTINFVTRTAPMGPVGANVAIAVFNNFNPDFVRRVIPAAWDHATPAQILKAHADAVSDPLAQALATMPAGALEEYTSLARPAAVAASSQIGGRPLFAGFTDLPWPEEPHLVAWHAAKLLREHRGDGHVALLVANDLSGIEALVVHEAFGGLAPGILRRSRGWSRGQWAEAVDGLRTRGWLTDDDTPTLTEDGRGRRADIEDRTNQLAASAFVGIGDDGLRRLVDLGREVARAIKRAGMTLEALFSKMNEQPRAAGTEAAPTR